METALKVIVSLGICFLILAVLGGNTPEISTEAQTNTSENAFMSGCEETGADAMTKAETRAYCQCALGELKKMYPNWSTDAELLKRLNREGYTQAETDKFVTCLQ
jgi:hypothetical protein